MHCAAATQVQQTKRWTVTERADVTNLGALVEMERVQRGATRERADILIERPMAGGGEVQRWGADVRRCKSHGMHGHWVSGRPEVRRSHSRTACTAWGSRPTH
jgi:hypothetical protein